MAMAECNVYVVMDSARTSNYSREVFKEHAFGLTSHTPPSLAHFNEPNECRSSDQSATSKRRISQWRYGRRRTSSCSWLNSGCAKHDILSSTA
mmetsp:Transcript_8205/g.19239  ORF Transcript_8205/g.19239 Transcript_8205/m.19239 type:complete len:93 (-) Transcript_8205:7-285(-)